MRAILLGVCLLVSAAFVPAWAEPAEAARGRGGAGAGRGAGRGQAANRGRTVNRGRAVNRGRTVNRGRAGANRGRNVNRFRPGYNRRFAGNRFTYHNRYARRLHNGGYYYRGRAHYHWGWSGYSAAYGTTLYYDPGLTTYFYWAAPYAAYLPVTYVPLGTYVFPAQAAVPAPAVAPAVLAEQFTPQLPVRTKTKRPPPPPPVEPPDEGEDEK